MENFVEYIQTLLGALSFLLIVLGLCLLGKLIKGAIQFLSWCVDSDKRDIVKETIKKYEKEKGNK